MPQRLGSFEIDDDASRVDMDATWDFLSTEAYWARWRDRATVERQFACAWRLVGAYESATGRMVGGARAISDGEAIGYLADVWVTAECRGHGLGAALVAAMVEHGPGASLRWLLHTRDAHGLYAKFGFAPPDGSYLERREPPP